MVFSYKNFRELCKILSAHEGKIILKHDVEVSSQSVLRIASIEREFGLKSIFFYQFDVFKNNIDEAKKLISMGHEIGYHYDVLDNNSGDFTKATEEFYKNLEFFNKCGFSISWVCPHGNPTKTRLGWNSNKDFFRSADVRQRFSMLKDIVVDFDMLYPNFKYISDAGYKFKEIGEISHNDVLNVNDIPIADLACYLQSDPAKSIVISTHPHRWLNFKIHFFFKYYLFNFLRWLYRATGRVPFFSTIYNRFFRLARRF